MKSDQLRAL